MPNHESNQATFNAQSRLFEDVYMFPAEVAIWHERRDAWPTTRMLDLGVGGGRTTAVFGGIVKDYVGIDYAPNMIAAARQNYPDPRLRFEVGDARDLSAFPDGSFDFVLFSYNGIDYVVYEDREAVYREIRRVLAPNGQFFFSSHNLLSFPFRIDVPGRRKSPMYPIRWMRARWLQWKLAWKNRRVDTDDALRLGHALLHDAAEGLVTCYIRPEAEVEALRKCGLETVKLLNGRGEEVPADQPGPDYMIHFLCRPADTASV